MNKLYYIENAQGGVDCFDADYAKLETTLRHKAGITVNDIKTVPDGYTIRNFEIVAIEEAEAAELAEGKENKFKEALDKAKSYLEDGAYYRYDGENTIEATDGNIGKLTAYALALSTGTLETVTWTSKEDNVLTLTAEQVTQILTGLGAVQAYVWNVQYIAYKQAVEDAKTIDELNNITVEYSSEVPTVAEETTESGENVDESTADTDGVSDVSDEVETEDSATETE